MYGSIEEVDLRFLVGSELIQVCIGENEVVLRLNPDISVMIASNVVVANGEGEGRLYEDSRELGAGLLPLLGSRVISAEGTSEGTLIISWDIGPSISILDTWEHYESYTIRNGDDVIVV